MEQDTTGAAQDASGANGSHERGFALGQHVERQRVLAVMEHSKFLGAPELAREFVRLGLTPESASEHYKSGSLPVGAPVPDVGRVLAAFAGPKSEGGEQ